MALCWLKAEAEGDGSDLNIARNPKDADTYFQSLPTDKGFNQLHLNALYDLCEKRYTDAVIQPARKKNESPFSGRFVIIHSYESSVIANRTTRKANS